MPFGGLLAEFVIVMSQKDLEIAYEILWVLLANAKQFEKCPRILHVLGRQILLAQGVTQQQWLPLTIQKFIADSPHVFRQGPRARTRLQDWLTREQAHNVTFQVGKEIIHRRPLLKVPRPSVSHRAVAEFGDGIEYGCGKLMEDGVIPRRRIVDVLPAGHEPKIGLNKEL